MPTSRHQPLIFPPTTAMPGSAEKIEIMRLRFIAGFPVFNHLDVRDNFKHGIILQETRTANLQPKQGKTRKVEVPLTCENQINVFLQKERSRCRNPKPLLHTTPTNTRKSMRYKKLYRLLIVCWFKRSPNTTSKKKLFSYIQSKFLDCGLKKPSFFIIESCLKDNTLNWKTKKTTTTPQGPCHEPNP